jgi:hypothetical protein
MNIKTEIRENEVLPEKQINNNCRLLEHYCLSLYNPEHNNCQNPK